MLPRILVCVGVACTMLRPVSSHGILTSPAGRTSAWRYPAFAKYFTEPKNYGDNQLFCGGIQTQIANGYKCGVCGDAYNARDPKDNEVGGRFVSSRWRPIVANYTQGQTTSFTVKLTANHLGWVSFKLCPVNSFAEEATQGCLDQHPVPLAPQSRNFDQYRHLVYRQHGDITVQVQLPADLHCSLCTLQWRYHTGNSWGTDPVTGQSGLGLGYQEEFYACADVRIGPDVITDIPEPTQSATTRKTTSQTGVGNGGTSGNGGGTGNGGTSGLDETLCVSIGVWANDSHDEWCRANCIRTQSDPNCPNWMCSEECRVQ